LVAACRDHESTTVRRGPDFLGKSAGVRVSLRLALLHTPEVTGGSLCNVHHRTFRLHTDWQRRDFRALANLIRLDCKARLNWFVLGRTFPNAGTLKARRLRQLLVRGDQDRLRPFNKAALPALQQGDDLNRVDEVDRVGVDESLGFTTESWIK